MKLPTTTIATDIEIASSRERRLDGVSFELPQHHARDVGHEPAQADSFQDGWPIAGRRFGPHGFGRRQADASAIAPNAPATAAPPATNTALATTFGRT